VWRQGEMRVGQKNKLTYRWARKGSRPPAGPLTNRCAQLTYLFGAVCPERGPAPPSRCRPVTAKSRNSISTKSPKVTPGAHGIVLLDQTGWHVAKILKVPSNISPMPLPPRPQRPGKHLAIPATAHRLALEDRVRRTPRLGSAGYSM